MLLVFVLVGLLAILALRTKVIDLILPAANAQTQTVELKSLNELHSIDLGVGGLKMVYSPLGIYLKSSISDIEEIECTKQNSTEIYFLYYFVKGIKERKQLRDHCSKQKLGASYFVRSPQKEETQLEKILRYYFSEKNKKDLNIENYYEVTKKLKEYKTSLIREILLVHWHFYFNRLDNVRIQLEELFQHSQEDMVIELDFSIEGNILDSKDGMIRLRQIFDEVMRLSEARLDQRVYDTFLNFLSAYDWSDIDSELDSKIKENSKISNDRLRRIVRDFRWGKRFPHIWGHHVYSNLGPNALKTYVEKFFNIPGNIVDKKLANPYMSVILDNKNRKMIYGYMKNLKYSKLPKDKRLLLNLADDRVFIGKKYKGEVIISRTFFQDRRTFYKSMIAKSKWTMFSLYQLLKLGDFKFEYLKKVKK